MDGIPVIVNSPVFTLTIVDGNSVLEDHLVEPLLFDYRQLEVQNRSNPQCVYWNYENRSDDKLVTLRTGQIMTNMRTG